MDSIEKKSREGLQLLSELLSLVVSIEEGDKSSNSGVDSGQMVPEGSVEPKTRFDALESALLLHFVDLCASLVALHRPPSVCANWATEGDNGAREWEEKERERGYIHGTAALVCAWLLDHSTLTAEAEAEMVRARGMDNTGVWWWRPPALSTMHTSTPKGEGKQKTESELSASWVLLALQSAALPWGYHRSVAASRTARVTAPTPPPPLDDTNASLSALCWHSWLWDTACKGDAQEGGETFLHCYVHQMLQLTAHLPAPPNDEAIARDGQSALTCRLAFAHRMPLTCAALCGLYEAKGNICYNSAVTHTMAAVQRVLCGYRQRFQEKDSTTDAASRGTSAVPSSSQPPVDETELEREIIRSAFAGSASPTFQCLVHATDAARIAASQWGSEDAVIFLEQLLRPALLGCVVDDDGGDTTNKSDVDTLLWVHPGVELCSNSLRLSSFAGSRVPPVGVVATSRIEEGELLSSELPIAMWLRQMNEANTASPPSTEGEQPDELSPRAALFGSLLHSIRDAEMTLRSRLSEGTLFSPADGATDCSRNGKRDSAGPCFFDSSVQRKAKEAASESGSAASPHSVAQYLRLLSLLPWSPACVSGESPAPSEQQLVEAGLNYFSSANNATGIRGVDLFKIGLTAYNPKHTFLGGDEKEKDWWSSATEFDAGKAGYYYTHFYRHSCSPNTLLVFPTEGPPAPEGQHLSSAAACSEHSSRWFQAPIYTGEVVAVALRPIEAGEELTVSYIASPLVSQEQKRRELSFECGCSFCATKTALLEGVVCMECRQLLFTPPAFPFKRCDNTALLLETRAYQHSDECPMRKKSDRVSITALHTTQRFEIALENIYRELDEFEGKDTHRCESSWLMRRLLDLDTAASGSFLRCHYLRWRVRQELLAVATATPNQTVTEMSQLLSIGAELCQDAELMLPPNHCLTTGLRMQYAFLRGRYITATSSAAEAAGVRQGVDSCCGAVREEAAVLQRPFLTDHLLRGCVIRCFQEHYIQVITCSNSRNTRRNSNGGDSNTGSEGLGESGILGSFLKRFPVELLAVGINNPENFAMLSMMMDEEDEGGAGGVECGDGAVEERVGRADTSGGASHLFDDPTEPETGMNAPGNRSILPGDLYPASYTPTDDPLYP